jgi:hypothetical protein
VKTLISCGREQENGLIWLRDRRMLGEKEKGHTFFGGIGKKEKKYLDKAEEFVYHQPNITNAMTGKTSLRAFQRAVGCCETVCGQSIYWPLSSQLKVPTDL